MLEVIDFEMDNFIRWDKSRLRRREVICISVRFLRVGTGPSLSLHFETGLQVYLAWEPSPGRPAWRLERRM